MRLAVQFDVQANFDFNTAAEAVTRGVEALGWLIELEPGEDYTWIGLVEDVPEGEANRLRDKIERLLSDLGAIEYHNVLLLDSGEIPDVGPLGPRSRPSGLAERHMCPASKASFLL